MTTYSPTDTRTETTDWGRGLRRYHLVFLLLILLFHHTRIKTHTAQTSEQLVKKEAIGETMAGEVGTGGQPVDKAADNSRWKSGHWGCSEATTGGVMAGTIGGGAKAARDVEEKKVGGEEGGEQRVSFKPSGN